MSRGRSVPVYRLGSASPLALRPPTKRSQFSSPEAAAERSYWMRTSKNRRTRLKRNSGGASSSDREREREEFWCRALLCLSASALDAWCAELCCTYLQFWVLTDVGSASLSVSATRLDFFKIMESFGLSYHRVIACSLRLKNRQFWDCKRSYMRKVMGKEKIRPKTKD